MKKIFILKPELIDIDIYEATRVSEKSVKYRRYVEKSRQITKSPDSK